METFGTILRAAVLKEHTTDVKFAAALGVTAGRVSQILSGNERISRRVLAGLLKAFTKSKLRKEIRDAWILEYMPLQYALDSLGTEDAGEQASFLLKDHQPHQALDLVESRRARTPDCSDWHELSRVAAEINKRLVRPAAALRIVSEMEQRARCEGNQVHILEALRLKCHVSIDVSGIRPLCLSQLHEDALRYAETYKPQAALRNQWQKTRSELARDGAMILLKAHEFQDISIELFKKALSGIGWARSNSKDETGHARGLLVRAKVEIAAGHIGNANEALDEIAGHPCAGEGDFPQRIRIVKARLAILSDKCPKAMALLESICAQCLENEDPYYHRIADQLLARLTLGHLPRIAVQK